MRSSCRRRSVAAIAPFIDSVDDALFVIDASMTTDRFGLSVLLLTGGRRLLAVIELRDVDEARVDAACDMLLEAASGSEAAWRAAVVATDRTGRGVGATADDHQRFRQLRERFSGAGIELIDWLLLDRAMVCSLAEATGTDDVWASGGEP